MRLFVAIPLEKEIKDYIEEIQKHIGNSDAKIAWVPKSQLHITLKFLGEVKESKKIQEALTKVKQKKIKIQTSKIDCFKQKEGEVLYLKVEPEKELQQLAFAIDEQTINISNDKPFKTHITIGRVKKIKFPKDYEKKVKTVEIEQIKDTIEKFQLIQSKLTSSGAKYTTLEEYQLE